MHELCAHQERMSRMRIIPKKFIQMTPDVPDIIRAPMMLNTVSIEFEPDYSWRNQKPEVTFNDLYVWCTENSASLFSCYKITQGQCVFMFYEKMDMTNFLTYFQKLNSPTPVE